MPALLATSAAAVSRVLSENGMRTEVASRRVRASLHHGDTVITALPEHRADLENAVTTLRMRGYRVEGLQGRALGYVVVGRTVRPPEVETRPVGSEHVSSISRLLRRSGWTVAVHGSPNGVLVDPLDSQPKAIATILREDGYDFQPSPVGGHVGFRVTARTSARRRR